MRVLADFKGPPPLTHLKRLTTKDGLLQHADREVPDPSHGYSIDDNARALIVCLWHSQIFKDPAVLHLGEVYFNYIKKVEKEGGTFHNFLTFTERTLEPEGSEDSIGRAIWALGETARLHPDPELKENAKAMIKRADLNKHFDHPHIRTKAYILLGLTAEGDKQNLRRWADRLVEIYRRNAVNDWAWFEDSLRYANGILPYALTKAFLAGGSNEYLEAAKRSFAWLDETCRVNNIPSPIGQAGWYFKDGERATYDQQPLEAADMVLAATALFEATGERRLLDLALEWMSWYYGHNVQSQLIINNDTGGIYDGLTPGGVNENQGAESIVTYLLAYLSLSRLAKRNNGD